MKHIEAVALEEAAVKAYNLTHDLSGGRWPLVVLDEEGNELEVLALEVDEDGEQILMKVRA